MFLSTWTPDPILLSVGSLTIYWYGVCLAIGALAGLIAIIAIGQRYGLSRTFLTDVFVLLVVGGFIGGRLYHVVNEWGYYANRPIEIIQVWNGGLAIHGAMLVGLLIVWLMAQRQKIDSWRLADVLVVGLALGQAIGRWGNYFNQELFGGPTSLPWKMVIDPAHRPPQVAAESYFHPTFLYESLGCLVIFGLLFFLHHLINRSAPPRLVSAWRQPGTIALTYFVLYSFLRIGMESLRIDQVPIVAGLRLPLLSSIIIILIALTIYFIRRRNANVVH